MIPFLSCLAIAQPMDLKKHFNKMLICSSINENLRIH